MDSSHSGTERKGTPSEPLVLGRRMETLRKAKGNDFSAQKCTDAKEEKKKSCRNARLQKKIYTKGTGKHVRSNSMPKKIMEKRMEEDTAVRRCKKSSRSAIKKCKNGRRENKGNAKTGEKSHAKE